MKLLENRVRVLSVIIVALVLVSLCSYLYAYASLPPHSEDSIEHWEKRISQVGPERAYNEFKSLVKADKAAVKHDNAHRFGAALFKAEGLSGIRYCVPEFWYGCFHYFVAYAVMEHGLTDLPGLMESCMNEDIPSYPCYHGVGHGIMIVSGYDLVGVESALSHCRELLDDTKYHCLYGAFMEFNSGNLLLDVSSSSVAFSPRENPYGICESLHNPSMPERMWCIASLPQWWTTRGDVDKKLQGQWCSNIRNSEEEDACFQAIGKTTLFEKDPSPAKTHALCKAASVDHRSNVICVSGAIKLSFNHPDLLREPPEKLCDMFEDIEDRELCKLYIQPDSSPWARFYDFE